MPKSPSQTAESGMTTLSRLMLLPGHIGIQEVRNEDEARMIISVAINAKLNGFAPPTYVRQQKKEGGSNE
ncbi:hypothetical protein [Desulfitobacterium sp. AusDCA]|uniref:hypothetical protein n=1 Tax=Desulfitobacterium sp. AusDCA TaxID=3240383 RepID=UPI003DA73553